MALGLILDYRLILSGFSVRACRVLMAFSGIVSNFVGVPLVFVVIAVLGRLEPVILVLRDLFGIIRYGRGCLFSV